MLHRHGVNVGGETVIVVICHHHAGEKVHPVVNGPAV